MAATVASLHIYPVKGLKGIELQEALCTDRGFEHDRRWMLVDRDGQFLSQRSHPALATIWTDVGPTGLTLSAPDVGEVCVPVRPAAAPPVRVTVWNSTCDAMPVSADADRWLSDYLRFDCRLVFMPDETHRPSNPEFAGPGKLVSFADGYAYLVIGEASVDDLNARLRAKSHPALPMNRFRPNIVLRGTPPYDEDHLGEVRIGQALLRGVKPCGRCEVTTTDQSTGERRGPEPLATLATYRDSTRFGVMFGMNLVTVKTGVIRVGDAVERASVAA